MNIDEKLAGTLSALRQGKPVIVLDDEGRENEADVILAAATATEEWIAWTVRHSSGVLCVPLSESRADELELPPMVQDSQDPYETAYTVSVDAATGISTGISAADRLRTIRVLADSNSGATDLRRPGHIFPLRARDGGVLVRRGHTEAAVDLCALAGLAPVGVICELVHEHGPVLRAPAAEKLAREHALPVLTIEDLVIFRRARGDLASSRPAPVRITAQTPQTPSPITVSPRVKRGATSTLPTEHGTFTAIAYRDESLGVDHLALLHSGVSPKSPDVVDTQQAKNPPVVRIHSECLTGDALGSLRCDCGKQLDSALEQVAQRGGAVIYLRGQEGRGIGLGQKIAAYALQDQGLDTVDANIELGLPIDSRNYFAAAQILKDLQMHAITMLTNNPQKVAQLEAGGITVARREALYVGTAAQNERYMQTKADRLGHRYQNAPRKRLRNSK